MRDRSRRPRAGTLLMLGGLLLMAAALLLTGYNLWDDWRASAAAEQVLEQMPAPAELPEQPSTDSGEQKTPDYILDPSREMPTVEIDGNAYIGTLDIPSLDLSLPVMSDWSYPKLRVAPCRYAGTAYQSGFVIAAHNYRTHFGPLSRITVGDRVTFTDLDGNVFYYQVAEVQVLKPTAIEEMVSDDWDLSLFTCTLGGQTRLTVRCEKAEASDLLSIKKQVVYYSKER